MNTGIGNTTLVSDGCSISEAVCTFTARQSSKHWPYVLGLIAISTILLLVGLGDRPLWDIDEGMHAVIAQNMVRSGDWVTPVFNGVAFMDKPPFVNWLNASVFSVLGFSEFAARLPSAMMGVGCVLLTYFLGCKLRDRPTGLIAAIILATSLEFIILSRVVQYDIPFTFLTTLALYFFCVAFVDQNHRALSMTGFYVSVALAILTKGPLGIVLPALAIGIFLIQQRRLAFLRDMLLTRGIAIVLLIAGPWFVLMEHANPGYFDYFIMQQHLANLFGAAGDSTARHPETIYYFLPVLVAGMFPWSLLLPQALIAIARSRDRSRSNPMMLLVIWTVSIFIFFSLASSKLSTYILPIFPTVAILTGTLLIDFHRRGKNAQHYNNLIATAVAALIVVSSATVYVLLADPWILEAKERAIDWQLFEWLLISLTLIAACMVLTLVKGRNRTSFAVASSFIPLLIVFLLTAVMPQLDTYKSGKEIGFEYEKILGRDEKMIFANRELDSVMFYTNRESITVGSEERIRTILDSDETVFLLLSNRSDAATDQILNDYYVIRQLGNKSIISNRSTASVIGMVLTR